jgi:hypothetical protein
VYKLFTREFGVLYVHGQSVRELRNRNRYALRTHTLALVTLVRGRDTWRLTSAQARERVVSLTVRRILALTGTLLAQEDPAPRLFDLLHTTLPVEEGLMPCLMTHEAILALFVLHELGYVARPYTSLTDQLLEAPYEPYALSSVYVSRRDELVTAVNTALHGLPYTGTRRADVSTTEW